MICLPCVRRVPLKTLLSFVQSDENIVMPAAMIPIIEATIEIGSMMKTVSVGPGTWKEVLQTTEAGEMPQPASMRES